MVEPRPPLPKSQMTPVQRASYGAVRRLLRKEWNPIGVGDVVPDDEYDSYALQLFGMLLNGASVVDSATYLGMIESKWIGLPERPTHNIEVAAKAHAIVAALKTREEFAELSIQWMTPKQREALATLHKLLRYEWNPIDPGGLAYELGGLPEDEYADYAPTLFALIDRGGSVDEAARFLAVIETAFMCLRERPERNSVIGAKAHAIVTEAKSPK